MKAVIHHPVSVRNYYSISKILVTWNYVLHTIDTSTDEKNP